MVGIIQALKISALFVGFNVGYTPSDAPLNTLKKKKVNVTLQVKRTNLSLVWGRSG